MVNGVTISIVVEYPSGKQLAIWDEIKVPETGIFAGLNPSPGAILTKLRDSVEKLGPALEKDAGWRR